VILSFDQTGHVTCLKNRTSALAKNTDGLPAIRPELGVSPPADLDERIGDFAPTEMSTMNWVDEEAFASTK
jgi:hypothetical protein